MAEPSRLESSWKWRSTSNVSPYQRVPWLLPNGIHLVRLFARSSPPKPRKPLPWWPLSQSRTHLYLLASPPPCPNAQATQAFPATLTRPWTATPNPLWCSQSNQTSCCPWTTLTAVTAQVTWRHQEAAWWTQQECTVSERTRGRGWWRWRGRGRWHPRRDCRRCDGRQHNAHEAWDWGDRGKHELGNWSEYRYAQTRGVWLHRGGQVLLIYRKVIILS